MTKIDTLQNLILIAASDGAISSAEKTVIYHYANQINLSEDIVDLIIEHVDQLEYAYPEMEKDKRDELVKLILLALTDREISEEEHRALHNYAAICGIAPEDVFDLIQQISDNLEEEEAQSVLRRNQAQYDDVLHTIRESGLKDFEIADKLDKASRSRSLHWQFSDTAAVNEAFYKFLWLMFRRYSKLNDSGVIVATIQLALAKSGDYTMEDIISDYKLTEEAYFDGIKISFGNLAQIKKELAAGFPFSEK